MAEVSTLRRDDLAYYWIDLVSRRETLRRRASLSGACEHVREYVIAWPDTGHCVVLQRRLSKHRSTLSRAVRRCIVVVPLPGFCVKL